MTGRSSAVRWQLMSEAVRAFAESTDRLDSLVPAIAEYFGRAVDAACLVRLLSDDQRFLNPSALWCPDDTVEPLLRRTVAAAPIRVDEDTTVGRALKQAGITRPAEVSLVELGVHLRPEHEMLRADIEPSDLVLVALRDAQRCFGLAYIIRRTGQPRLTIDDDALLEDLSRQASTSLGHAVRFRSLEAENQALRRDGRSHPSASADDLRRLDALAAIASGLAHDYDNLLSVIQMCINLRQEALDDADPQRAELDDIRSSVARAAELTPKLAVLAQRRIVEPEVIDPVEFLRTRVDDFSGLFEESGGLDVNLTSDGRQVCVDRPQFVQAVTQLLLNARQAVLSFGRVRLTVRHREVKADDLIGVSSGTYVAICVEDSGSGMTPQTMARVAQPFFSRWPSDRSNGLGLTSVVAFARQSGGTLTVTTGPEGGASVSLLLPVVNGVAGTMAPSSSRLDGFETVMLVVNDVAYRAELRALLRRHGYQVLDTQTFRQAISVAESYSELIHLVIIDASSAQTIPPLKLRCPQTVFLTISGNAPPAEPHLQRAQQEAEILTRVRRALEQRAGPSSGLHQTG